MPEISGATFSASPYVYSSASATRTVETPAISAAAFAAASQPEPAIRTEISPPISPAAATAFSVAGRIVSLL